MKATRIYALFALLVIAAGSQLQAQELQDVYISDKEIWNMIYLNDDVFLAIEGTSAIHKIKDDGTVLASQVLFENDTVNYIGHSELIRNFNGNPAFFRVERSNDPNVFRVYRLYEVDENLNITDAGFSYSLHEEIESANHAHHYFFNADGSFIYSVIIPPGNNADDSHTKVVKLDADGNLVGQQLFLNCARTCWYNNLLPVSESSGCRIIVGRDAEPLGLAYDCYTLDSQMNVVDVKENLEAISYPYVPASGGYYRYNSNSGRIYSIGDCAERYEGANPSYTRNIFMSVYDSDFNQLDFRRCPWETETGNAGGDPETIDFGPNNEVYMVAGMDLYSAITQNLYIGCFDENLEVIGELYYKHPTRFMQYLNLVACPQGGCLVNYVDFSQAHESGILKVTISDFLNLEEAHSHGFAVAVAYPNPGKDVLNIRTTLQNAHVEIYDLSGKLIHKQQITDNITPITTTSWPSGTYIWKVLANGKEAESGKWIKQ